MPTIKNRLFRFLRREDGPTAVEYAMLLAVIVGVAFASIGFVGNAAGKMSQDSSESLNRALEEAAE